MRVVVLGSGSRGNAVVVESCGHRLLVDAGFSCRELERRMLSVGIDPASIEAIVLTHEHGDHARGAELFSRRYRRPVYATEGTLGAVTLKRPGRLLCSGAVVEVEAFRLEPFAVPHDAREPIGLVIEDAQGRRLGLAADLGSASRLAWARLRDLDLLILETNHDLEMLRNGPYPWVLKQRVAGRHGHLSNRQAADGVPELVCDRLRWVVLYHLSQTNNLPALAAAAIGEALESEGCRAETVVADQQRPTPWLEVAP